MAHWNIIFYPNPSQHHSPQDILAGLTKSEVASIELKLRTLADIRLPQDWPWVKLVQGMYQLKSDAIRIYFALDGNKIVITHVCRKVTQKARSEDLYRAQENYRKYLENNQRK